MAPTTTERKPTTPRSGHQAVPSPYPLTAVDVRRKRPPALSFLLRAQTLRNLVRIATLLALDFAGLFAAIFTALMVKAVIRFDTWAWATSYARGQEPDRLRLPGDRAAVRPLRPLRRARPAPGPAEDRHLALPVHGRRADLRGRQRRAVLELLHLLRDAVLRDRLRGLHPLGLREDHGHPAARRRLPPPRAARRLRAPHRGRRTTRSSTRCTRRSRWSASSRSRRGPTTACARSAGSRTSPRCSTPSGSRRSSSPTPTSRRARRSSSSTSATSAASPCGSRRRRWRSSSTARSSCPARRCRCSSCARRCSTASTTRSSARSTSSARCCCCSC